MINLTMVAPLIKGPVVNEKINVPGKTAVDFTFVNKVGKDNSITQWFTVTVFLASAAQADLALKLEKNTVVSFSRLRISKPILKEDGTQNFYCDASSFDLISNTSGDTGASNSSTNSRNKPASKVTIESLDDDPFAE